MPKSSYRLALSLLAGLFMTNTSQASDNIIISEAWSPEAPPVAKVMAGYLKLENKSHKEILVTEISSPQFKTIEIHRTVHENGMAKMLWQPHIHVPAGKVIKLETGGKHLMMFNPQRWLRAGERITLHITLSNNTQQTIHAIVRKR